MGWLTRLWRHPVPDAARRQALAAHKAKPAVAGTTPLSALRIVVADVETSGLDPLHDRLLSIGSVDLCAGKVIPASAFSVVLRQREASSTGNILIHGIDGSTQLAGLDPAEALLLFLEHVDTAPLAGFSADFDRMVIGRALKQGLSTSLRNAWLDLAWLAPALLPAPGRRATAAAATLDDWAAQYGIVNESRHHAVADAAVTAQLLQVVLAAAAAAGLRSLDDLQRLERDQRWLGRR